MAELLGGRDRALAYVGGDAWKANSLRPGWTASDPAQRLAALTARLRALQGLRAVLTNTEVALGALRGSLPVASA